MEAKNERFHNCTPMNTLKFTSILIRLAGLYFLTVGFDFLTYLPAQLFRANHLLTPSSQNLYGIELKMMIARILLYFTLSATCWVFTAPIAQFFARGLEDETSLDTL